jgi:metallophosphoesterase (TIGR00282 family)
VIQVLAIGDVMGKAGRNALQAGLARVRAMTTPHITIINGENAAGGFGLTRKIFDSFIQQHGVDCVTMGNHWHDKREILEWADREDRLVLPANMMNCQDDLHGLRLLRSQNGTEYAVVNLIGRAFMHADNRSPFTAVDRVLERIPDRIKVRIVDIHAEATSEKQAMAHYLSGRVSLVYGTHSHVPTSDERLIDGKTGFTTDLGMTGPYDSVIGIKKDASIRRLRTGEKSNFEPASEDLWFCGVLTEIDPVTGHCHKIQRLQWRGLDKNESSNTVLGKASSQQPEPFVI